MIWVGLTTGLLIGVGATLAYILYVFAKGMHW
jgi:hypothetical protein